MAYEAVHMMESSAQPAVKRLVIVNGHEAQVLMEVIPCHDDDVYVNNKANISPVPVTLEQAPTRHVLLSLIGQTDSLCRAITEQNTTTKLMSGKINVLRCTQTRMFRKFNENPLHQLQCAAARGSNRQTRHILLYCTVPSWISPISHTPIVRTIL